MEDLREVGQKVIESINKSRTSDVGDLVLGIGEIIEELREQPELYQDKLNHLEGLFRELVYGEEYELRDRSDPDKRGDFNHTLGGFNMPTVSGAFNNMPIVLSGVIPMQSIPNGVSSAEWNLNNNVWDLDKINE